MLLEELGERSHEEAAVASRRELETPRPRVLATALFKALPWIRIEPRHGAV